MISQRSIGAGKASAQVLHDVVVIESREEVSEEGRAHVGDLVCGVDDGPRMGGDDVGETADTAATTPPSWRFCATVMVLVSAVMVRITAVCNSPGE